jgi:hypothetical protein
MRMGQSNRTTELVMSQLSVVSVTTFPASGSSRDKCPLFPAAPTPLAARALTIIKKTRKLTNNQIR